MTKNVLTNTKHIAVWLGVLLCSCVCFSQPEANDMERNSFWVNIGGGVGILSPVNGFYSRLSISVERNRHVFSGRLFRLTEVIGDLVEPRSPRPEEVETEFAVLYGRDLSSSSAYIVVSIGLGYVQSEHRGRIVDEAPFGLVHETVSIGSLGFSLDAQVFFPIGGPIGLGVSFVGNFNTTRSFGGMLITLNFGSFN